MSADSAAGDAPRSTVPAPDYALESVVVRRDRGPNRCTCYPEDASEEARLTTWLSVDAAVVRDLDSMR
ncbi:hypothetical protein MBEHAL_1649 [Halarchaeum acidiphilum MH1-52-1]|uniref:DUF7511 domain-containing protein n=1 Tax=Halarchaeum acidiphilum MH1-52-1 TaxID=1261545 RepID=U3A5H8_9EURY|nr:hypothetical protein [Halarchaeum acidiphilum]GAD52889.1 hypothetical protein MBEHAL_1649 [Halarchaeum acidiphilum MH1-52-1]